MSKKSVNREYLDPISFVRIPFGFEEGLHGGRGFGGGGIVAGDKTGTREHLLGVDLAPDVTPHSIPAPRKWGVDPLGLSKFFVELAEIAFFSGFDNLFPTSLPTFGPNVKRSYLGVPGELDLAGKDCPVEHVVDRLKHFPAHLDLEDHSHTF